MQYFYLKVNIMGKEKVAGGSSWNRRAGTGSLTQFSSGAHVEGCVEPQEPLLCGAKSSYDNSRRITSALPCLCSSALHLPGVDGSEVCT